MLRFLAADSLTFDVETTVDVEAGRRLLGNLDADDDRVRRLMWDQAPRAFVKPILQQVVSIAAVRRQALSDGVRVKLIVAESPDERTMVRNLLSMIGLNASMQIVGFNSEAFDLPLLIQRALLHGLSVPAFCARPEKPWAGRDLFARYSDWHIDLMRELGGFGSVPSLSEACAALTILGGGKDVTGADVLALVLEGDLASVHRYCAKDAVRHFLILLRLCVLAGHVTADEAAREAADVCGQLEAYCAQPELMGTA